MEIQPYLFFDGRCEEAIDFYKATLGAKVEMMMRFEESPEPAPPGMVPANWGKKIMHAALKVGPTMVLASDGCATGGAAAFKGFGLSLTAPTEAEAHRLFGALGEGGQVQVPMSKTFFAPAFGTVTDKFGVTWMVLAAAAKQAAAA